MQATCPFEVDFNLAPERLKRRHDQRSLVQNPRIVHECVDGPQLRLHPVECLHHSFLVRDIACVDTDFYALLFARFLCRRLLFNRKVEQGDAGAGFCERFGDGGTDALCGSCDDSDFSCVGVLERGGGDGAVGVVLEGDG